MTSKINTIILAQRMDTKKSRKGASKKLSNFSTLFLILYIKMYLMEQTASAPIAGKRLWCLHITTWQPIKEKGEKGERQIRPV